VNLCNRPELLEQLHDHVDTVAMRGVDGGV